MMSLKANAEGKLHACRQVDDYAMRGFEFEEMGFLTFTVETYERRLEHGEHEMNEGNMDKLGRPRNESSHYLRNHPKHSTHYRILRSKDHHFLPNIVGSWFPRRDGEESMKPYYYGSMLALLKPWRRLEELKDENEIWETAFSHFFENASRRDRDVISGCQYYYESKNIAVEEKGEKENNVEWDIINENDDEQQMEDNFQERSMETSVGAFLELSTTLLKKKQVFVNDEDVLRYEKMQRHDKEYIHGQLGVEAARIQGIFPDNDAVWEVMEECGVNIATEDVDVTLGEWRREMEQSSLLKDDPELLLPTMETTSQPTVIQISDLQVEIHQQKSREDSMNDDEIIAGDISFLNGDQRRAYEIVNMHLKDTIAGKLPPQLLMIIPGEGGVGKSKVLQFITQCFKQNGMEDVLVKGAYTGIAASLIDGKTLHSLTAFPIRGGKQSAQTLRRLRDFWRDK
jgi:hypothetical protein